LDSTLFDWQRWRIGSPVEMLGIPCRTPALVSNRNLLRTYVVGWCEGSSTLCRPRQGSKAIMFYKNEQHFWFHLCDEEAGIIFPEIFYERPHLDQS
jgi:hypothetical protein